MTDKTPICFLTEMNFGPKIQIGSYGTECRQLRGNTA